MNHSPYFKIFSFLLIVLGFNATGHAQTPAPSQQADVPALIEKLDAKDPQIAMNSANSLIEIGESVIAPLVSALNERKSCQFQFVASGVVYQLDNDNDVVNQALIYVARGMCNGSSHQDKLMRRQSAMALGSKVEGIPVVAEWLSDKDKFLRRSAAFAFDELTEKIEGDRPDSIEVTPEILAATKAAIPALVKAVGDKDEIVNCMSYESIEQLQGSKFEELRSEAVKLMKGVKVRCTQ